MPTPEGLPSPASAIARIQTAFRDWLFTLALPFWADTGLDRPAAPGRPRGAVEQLSPTGQPTDPGFTRMRVQARQLYVFSEAARHGVSGAGAIAESILGFMSRCGATADGGWARLLHRNGEVLDPTRDLYDLAFVLFALAYQARLTGERASLHRAERSLGLIRTRMTHPAGGFANTDPGQPGWRQQNPHMHLLEASLALFEISQDARWADLASELVALFRTRFLDHATGTLGENFTADWRIAPGEAGDKVEPGHQAEWIWLLDRHRALTGEPVADLVAPLAVTCRQSGIGAETGLVRDETGRDGSLRRGSSRLWPQTEMLKAQCVLHRMALAAGDQPGASAHQSGIVRTADNLMNRYLIGAGGGVLPPGTWIDQLDAFGRPAIDRIPTSSFYHILSAWTELDTLRVDHGDRPALPIDPLAAKP